MWWPFAIRKLGIRIRIADFKSMGTSLWSWASKLKSLRAYREGYSDRA